MWLPGPSSQMRSRPREPAVRTWTHLFGDHDATHSTARPLSYSHAAFSRHGAALCPPAPGSLASSSGSCRKWPLPTVRTCSPPGPAAAAQPRGLALSPPYRPARPSLPPEGGLSNSKLDSNLQPGNTRGPNRGPYMDHPWSHPPARPRARSPPSPSKARSPLHRPRLSPCETARQVLLLGSR